MSIEFRVVPHLFTFAVGALVGLIVISFMVLPGTYSNREEMHQSYGAMVSKLTADQATDAMINQNKVRLQLLLRDLQDQPLVKFSTIHDVENVLIVQSGDSIQNKKLTSHTSPIILHDSIAGYVTVFLDAQNKDTSSTTLAILITALLLTSIAIWSLIQEKAIKTISHITQGIPSSEKQEESTNIPCQTIKFEEPPKAYAVILIKNFAVLQQQLSVETLIKTLSRVEKITKDVLALYNGAGFEIKDSYYILSFNASDTTNEALFRAVCSAHLIQELASIVNNIPLDLAALVSANQKDLTPVNVPVAGILLEETAAEDEQILRRIQFMEIGSENNQKIVSGFEQPFKSLLDNQRKQLSNLL